MPDTEIIREWRPDMQESQGARQNAFLFVVHFDPDGLTTIRDNIYAWIQSSDLEYETLNLWYYGPAPLKLPSELNLAAYRGVIIHPAVCYFPHNLIGIDDQIVPNFKTYSGVKVLAKQDEHFHTHAFAQFIADNDFDILVTCLSPDQVYRAYPEHLLDGVRIVQQLTSYVSNALLAMPQYPYKERPNDIGYRGSVQPLICGRLGYEKHQIGRVVRPLAEAVGLTVDISSRWEDRIMGEAWGEFLARSKSVLGVESGSNLFDFDGSMSAACDAFARDNANLDPNGDTFYRRAAVEFLGSQEGNVQYGQVSPRHFEAAATGTLQILYEGRYSDILVPNQHYFPLKRDLSNLTEAFELLSNEACWTGITRRAYADIISSSKYRYEGFTQRFDKAVESLLAAKSASRALPQASRRKSKPDVNKKSYINRVLNWLSALAPNDEQN